MKTVQVNTLLLKRGPEAFLPELEEGELFFCTDSAKIYKGTANGNVVFSEISPEQSDLLTSLGSMADLNQISPFEKKEIQREWEGLVATHNTIIARAIVLGINNTTQYTDCVNAKDSLQTYLEDTVQVWSSPDTFFELTNTDYVDKVNEYKICLENLSILITQQEITSRGLDEFGNYVGKIDGQNAGEVRINASTAANTLVSMAADDKLDAVEKHTWRQNWSNNIEPSYDKLIVFATNLSLTGSSEFVNAQTTKNNLETYLINTAKVWSEPDTVYNIVGTELSDVTIAYYQAIHELSQLCISASSDLAEANAISYVDGNFVTQTTHSDDIETLSTQLDGKITTWFGDTNPTINNYPASSWETEDDKNNHLGDLFFNKTTGKLFYFKKNIIPEVSYLWQENTDQDLIEVMETASTAQDTADNKRRVFIAEPTPPYDEGDLWTQGSDGDLKVCSVAKQEFESFDESDWVQATKYTDDTVYFSDPDNHGQTATWDNLSNIPDRYTENATPGLNLTNTYMGYYDGATWQSFLNGFDGSGQIAGGGIQWDSIGNLSITGSVHIGNPIEVREDLNVADGADVTDYAAIEADAQNRVDTAVATLQAQIDGNITTWFYDGVPTLSNIPYTDWSDDTERNNHLGDLYYDNLTGYAYRFKTEGTSYAWTKLTDADVTEALSVANTAKNTADSKIVTFAQDEAPTASGEGDIWIDTNDNNKIYRWSGSAWEPYLQDTADWTKVFGTGKPDSNADVTQTVLDNGASLDATTINGADLVVNGKISTALLNITDGRTFSILGSGSLHVNTEIDGAGIVVGNWSGGEGWQMNNTGLFSYTGNFPLHGFANISNIPWQRHTESGVGPIDSNFVMNAGDVVLGAYNYKVTTTGDAVGGIFWNNSTKELKVRGAILEESLIGYDQITDGPPIDADNTANNQQSWSWIAGQKPDINADKTSTAFYSQALTKNSGDITIKEGADLIFEGGGADTSQISFQPTTNQNTWITINAGYYSTQAELEITPYNSSGASIWSLGTSSLPWAVCEVNVTGAFTVDEDSGTQFIVNSGGFQFNGGEKVLLGGDLYFADPNAHLSYLLQAKAMYDHRAGDDHSSTYAPYSHMSTVGSTSIYGHLKLGTTAGTAAQGNHTHSGYAPTNHRSTSTTYGVGTTTYYGHLKLGTAAGTACQGNDSRLLTTSQKTDLTDGGQTSLHVHNHDDMLLSSGTYLETNFTGASVLSQIKRDVSGHIKSLNTRSLSYSDIGACSSSDYRLSNARTPTSHRSTSTTYGVGTTSYYGHLKLGTVAGTAAQGNHTHSGYASSSDSRFLTTTQKTDLTDGGSTTLHNHQTLVYGGYNKLYASSSTVYAYADIRPSSGGLYDLGTSSSYWEYIYGKNIYYHTVTAFLDTVDDLQVIDDMKPSKKEKVHDGITIPETDRNSMPGWLSNKDKLWEKIQADNGDLISREDFEELILDEEELGFMLHFDLGKSLALAFGGVRMLNKEVTEDVVEPLNAMIESLISRVNALEGKVQ